MEKFYKKKSDFYKYIDKHRSVHRKLCTLYGGHILMKETKDFVVILSGTDISNELIYIYIYIYILVPILDYSNIYIYILIQ